MHQTCLLILLMPWSQRSSGTRTVSAAGVGTVARLVAQHTACWASVGAEGCVEQMTGKEQR